MTSRGTWTTALVGLRHNPALSEGRVDELIRLYEALSPHDRAPSSLPSPLQVQASSGVLHGSEAAPPYLAWKA